MKRVSLLENGDILYFSNIIEKDDGLKIYCQAIEKATRNKFEPIFLTKKPLRHLVVKLVKEQHSTEMNSFFKWKQMPKKIVKGDQRFI